MEAHALGARQVTAAPGGPLRHRDPLLHRVESKDGMTVATLQRELYRVPTVVRAVAGYARHPQDSPTPAACPVDVHLATP